MTELQRCENAKKCQRPATRFAQGHHTCADHDPPGSPTCPHSPAPSGRCAYCGAVTERPPAAPVSELAALHRTGHRQPDHLERLEYRLAHLEAARHLERIT